MPADEWVDAVWPIHSLEYHSAIKKKAILAHAATQMNLEGIVRREKSQTQKDPSSMLLLPRNI